MTIWRKIREQRSAHRLQEIQSVGELSQLSESIPGCRSESEPAEGSRQPKTPSVSEPSPDIISDSELLEGSRQQESLGVGEPSTLSEPILRCRQQEILSVGEPSPDVISDSEPPEPEGSRLVSLQVTTSEQTEGSRHPETPSVGEPNPDVTSHSEPPEGSRQQEIQSVGELSQLSEPIQGCRQPETPGVGEPSPDVTSDSEPPEGSRQQEIQRVGEHSLDGEHLPDYLRVAGITCAHCRRLWRRVRGLRMDNMVRVSLAAETGPSLEEEKLDNDFPKDFKEQVEARERTKRKKSLLRKKLQELESKLQENLPPIEEYDLRVVELSSEDEGGSRVGMRGLSLEMLQDEPPTGGMLSLALLQDEPASATGEIGLSLAMLQDEPTTRLSLEKLRDGHVGGLVKDDSPFCVDLPDPLVKLFTSTAGKNEGSCICEDYQSDW